MTFRFTFIFTFCLISTLVWSQKVTQTIYFNEQNDSVSTKQEASYYNVITTVNTNRSVDKYNIKDIKIGEFYYKKALNILKTDSIWYLYGAFKEWYPTGELQKEGMMVYNSVDGIFKTYYKGGQIKRHDIYKKDSLLVGHCYNENGDTLKYFPYYQNPEYKEGQAALFRFLAQNIRYPVKARRKGIEGTVYMGFVVDKEGKIVNVKVKRGVHQLIDEEASRVVKMMDNWTPGKIDGELASVSYTLPIKFKLD